VVSVSDNGIGIAPEHIEVVFEMFSQLGTPEQGPKAGLGIGLALCRALVHQHGGHIGAASGGLGQGSVFTIRLPMEGAARVSEIAADRSASMIGDGPGVGDAHVPTHQPPAPLSHPGPRRVMVVDDNVDAANSLTTLLKLEGYDAVQAHDGAAALQLGQSWHPDVVLMDIGMPVMDGYECATRMRATSWGGNVLLVAVTGWGQSRDRVRSTAAGFDRHLVKPIDMDLLDQLLVAAPYANAASQ
jgi:CheY-like chemotaxis protein